MTPRRNQASMLYRSYDETRQLLEQISLPALIICCVCHTYYIKSNFPANQLNNLCQAIYENKEDTYDPHRDIPSPTQQVAKCITCAQSQVVERKCDHCDKFRSLHDFSKNQRSRSTSYCVYCMQEQMGTDPDAETSRMQTLCKKARNPDLYTGLGAALKVNRNEVNDDYKSAHQARRMPAMPTQHQYFDRTPRAGHNRLPLPAPQRAPSLLLHRRLDNRVDGRYL
ncbi:hypothetical protein PENANT_c029G10964 [Penicillium antarcticum]|uniref:Stc1 domain-containing protein n=1 Tax=Penicillium antarcticum TaxID=416450 RepID=A0A1V6PVT4_9EURO|nr:hypothetical protein PENANT_c029G10964 [Penicillium antarcticum]